MVLSEHFGICCNLKYRSWGWVKGFVRMGKREAGEISRSQRVTSHSLTFFWVYLCNTVLKWQSNKISEKGVPALFFSNELLQLPMESLLWWKWYLKIPLSTNYYNINISMPGPVLKSFKTPKLFYMKVHLLDKVSAIWTLFLCVRSPLLPLHPSPTPS